MVASKDKDPAAETKAAEAKATEARAAEAKAAEAEQQEQDSEEPVTANPIDPYPAYEEMELSELRSKAQERGVGVPADVEKAALVAHLRKVGPEKGLEPETETGSYDLMPVESLRGLVPEGTSALSEGEERGYLMGQLRAVDSGPTAAQAATQGTGRPAAEDVSGVQDKDRGRG